MTFEHDHAEDDCWADHRCPWRTIAEGQAETVNGLAKQVAELGVAAEAAKASAAEELAALKAAASARNDELERQLAQLRKQVFGKRSEKMPPVNRELSKEGDPEQKKAAAQGKRRKNAELKAELDAERIVHTVPPEEKQCPKCGNATDRPVGEGRKTVLYHWEPGRFIRQEHIQEVLACRCGQHVVTAPPPCRVYDKCLYSPEFLAFIVVAKCGDSLPVYRLEKRMKRLGLPMSRSTMNDLFHRAAELLRPLYLRMLERIALCPVVLADETSFRLQGMKKKPFFWTFIGGRLIAYCFSMDRSGATPANVLGGTKGTLIVDAYTGYNHVTDVDGRERGGCLGHARRKFFEALQTAPVEADVALGMIRDLYRIEHDALAAGVVRTKAHRELRQTRGRPIADKLYGWLVEQRSLHLPKSPMGRAIAYALNQWAELTLYLDNEQLPIDNNASERALRVVALGRKNFLFVGHEEAGVNVAIHYSLVTSCEANGINPEAYLADVLIRIQTHPASDIDALLPDRWTPNLG